ncbi:hypothetical protein BKA56DRAFT_619393 [Ilyonectria sp. MPI-CAGE-AT-0026]|nr:hypothetical protein BKA56DRAFT_619393 [Ilyonectria sp. MPI-CAGE-AT-0026]
MATPNLSKGDCLPQAVPLPDMSITQRVCARYCKDVLPSLPFTTPSAILEHLHAAYEGWQSVLRLILDCTRLFWSAYALDRKRAILDDLPVAVPERAIDAELLNAPQNYPFELYRLMYEIHAVKDPADQAWQQSIQMRLGGWNPAYRENNDSPCRLLEADYDLAIAKFHHKIS